MAAQSHNQIQNWRENRALARSDDLDPAAGGQEPQANFMPTT